MGEGLLVRGLQCFRGRAQAKPRVRYFCRCGIHKMIVLVLAPVSLIALGRLTRLATIKRVKFILSAPSCGSMDLVRGDMMVLCDAFLPGLCARFSSEARKCSRRGTFLMACHFDFWCRRYEFQCLDVRESCALTTWDDNGLTTGVTRMDRICARSYLSLG